MGISPPSNWLYFTPNVSNYVLHLPSSAAKVAGTAIPKEPSEGWQSSWSFSTGDELLIKWGASRSISDICFDLKCQPSSDSWVRHKYQDSNYIYKLGINMLLFE